jgi:signal transduction histidine kinase
MSDDAGRKRQPDQPERSAQLEELTQRMRGSLASLRAAGEALERFPGMEAEQRRRLHDVVADESSRLGELVDALERMATGTAHGDHRPTRADDLLQWIQDAIARSGIAAEVDADGHLSSELEAARLEIHRETLTAAFHAFATSLRKDFAVVRCRLGTTEIDHHWLLDWSWLPDPLETGRLQDWQGAALETGDEGPALRAVARDHGGEAWFDLDRNADNGGRRAHVRVLLPLSEGDGGTP